MPTVFHRYTALVKKYPYRVNALTSGLLFGLGDYVSQRLFPDANLHHHDPEAHPAVNMFKLARFDTHDTPYNYQRTLRAVVYGLVVFSPLATWWQTRMLPRIHFPMLAFRRQYMSATTQRQLRLHIYDTMARLFVDQMTMPSLVFIPLYNFCMVAMAGYDHPFAVTREKLEKNWWNVLKASWTVWGGFQLALLLWIPVHLRVLAANFWQVGWLSFLSYCHNSKHHSKLLDELVEVNDQELSIGYK